MFCNSGHVDMIVSDTLQGNYWKTMTKWMEQTWQNHGWVNFLPAPLRCPTWLVNPGRKWRFLAAKPREDGPESHGCRRVSMLILFGGVQESQATRLILGASLLAACQKSQAIAKKMMELQYNSFPQQIKIPLSNPSLEGAMREVGSVSLWSTSSIFCIPEIGPWPLAGGYHGMSCFYSNFSGKRFKHRVFRVDLVDVSVEVGGFWWSFGMILSWDSSHFTPKKRSKSKMSKIRVFATN